MNKPNKHSKQTFYFSQITLLGFIILGMWSMLMPACTHDPFSPIDPGPIDTTGFPIDTTPVDTMDGDTVFSTCSPDTVYFSKDILPLLVSNCAKSGCHDVQTHEEGVILNNYNNVLNTGKIKPFDLNKSKLYKAITTNGGEDRMPPSPAERLTGDQIALISKWIQQGAKDLTCNENAGTCDTVGVSFASYVAPIINTYCVGCHSAPGTAPSGDLSLNSYAAIRAAALNGKLVGSISWTNGYQQMPKGSNKLSDCKINKIKAWINEGAQNN